MEAEKEPTMKRSINLDVTTKAAKADSSSKTTTQKVKKKSIVSCFCSRLSINDTDTEDSESDEKQ